MAQAGSAATSIDISWVDPVVQIATAGGFGGLTCYLMIRHIPNIEARHAKERMAAEERYRKERNDAESRYREERELLQAQLKEEKKEFQQFLADRDAKLTEVINRHTVELESLRLALGK